MANVIRYHREIVAEKSASLEALSIITRQLETYGFARLNHESTLAQYLSGENIENEIAIS